MHRKPTLRIPLPRVDAGLISNLMLLASLATVCVAVAFLTDWRYGMLAGGILGFCSVVYLQRAGAFEATEEQADNVAPIRKSA